MAEQPPPQKEDTFHQARSKLVDAFARIEAKVIKSLDRAGRPIKGDTVATKLRALRDAATDTSLAAVSDSLDRLASLISVRADLVHGAMVLIDIDGERFANFRNARESVNKAQKATQISYKNLKSFADELEQISLALDRLKFNPPSSPLPPSPGAATDP